MAVSVSLKAVIDEMDVVSNDHLAYINRQTGELVTLSIEEISIVEEGTPTDDEPEWQQALIAKARDVLGPNDYLQLPSRHDIHEYAIMERFCSEVDNTHLRQLLLDQIHGSGAFRRFKEAIKHQGIAQDWYQFRAASLEAIAVNWLEAHQIPYHRENT